MDRLVIGIHGLNNKVAKDVLECWWRLAIQSGLKAISQPFFPFNFQLVYWADLVHSEPLDARIKDEKNPGFVANPYKELAQNYPAKINYQKYKSLERLEKITNRLFENEVIFHRAEDFSNRFIKKHFPDLDFYFKNKTGFGEAINRPIRDVVLERFANILLNNKRKKILIIAHSMGSIIAYDLLTQPENPFFIDVLVTLGSPLGQPTVASKFTLANPVLTKIKTPENLKHWYNLADVDDLIALDPSLNDDFAPNSFGVLPIDIIVQNGYEWENRKNAHTIYGYLQTQECAELIYHFLIDEKHKLYLWFTQKQGWFLDNILRKNNKIKKFSQPRPEKTQ